MKLWDKGYTTHNIVERFTVGNDRILDLKLARYDVQASRAHARMLHKIGILTDGELSDILRGLDTITAQIERGVFVIEPQFEDVHSKIEFALVSEIGEAGKKIHTTRSRNDQVLVDLHLYVKDELVIIKGLIKRLFETLMGLSEREKDVLMPGYTHMQVAMPSSFGLWFSAYAERLIDDLTLLHAAYRISDQNPLGSAAGYGTSFPIDRSMTTQLLGFRTLKYNVVAAQMSRGRLEQSVAFAMASVSGTLAQLAADVCLYMSQNYHFISFPKELTTGSSIMPHKQNPDVFELLRARSNKICNLPSEIMHITGNLPSGYHRDYQLLKESLMGGIEGVKDHLEVCDFMLQHIRVRRDLLEEEKYRYIFSVEEVNKLVMAGVPFREAYRRVGKDILEGRFEPDKRVSHTHEGSLGNLCLKEIRAKFDEEYGQMPGRE